MSDAGLGFLYFLIWIGIIFALGTILNRRAKKRGIALNARGSAHWQQMEWSDRHNPYHNSNPFHR
jgi:hypothetical protein